MERYYVEVDFFEDELNAWNDVWTSTTKTYGSRTAAEKAAVNLEIRNAQNGASCRTRIKSYPVVK